MSHHPMSKGLREEMIRRSQSIAPYGVGSIIDLPDESVMPLSIDHWPKNVLIEIRDPRLERRLGVSSFRMIPSKDEAPQQGIPCVRFPRWLFCLKCRSLKNVDEWKILYTNRHSRAYYSPTCYLCRAPLVPSRFIVVCPNGHIDDFPWVSWVHRDDNGCSNADLEIRTKGSDSGLSGIVIRCKTCGAKRDMTGAFADDAHEVCNGNMPWLQTTEYCTDQPKTLQRGASNAYFPLVVNSIVIPEVALDTLDDRVRQSHWWPILRDNGDDECIIGTAAKKLAEELNQPIDQITKVIERTLNTTAAIHSQNQFETDYRYDEHRVFRGDKKLIDSNDLHIQIIPGSKYKLRGIERVTLVHRLREVRALLAFSRIYPLDRQELPDEGQTNKRGNTVFVRGDRARDWLPAVEVRGEGIFIEFEKQPLQEWASETWAGDRAKLLTERYNEMASQRKLPNRIITPQFVFVHTFAHLLIRQLTFECGYGSASIRERLYCNRANDENFMAGILVYTASGDSDGTLGGLVRQGQPDLLPSLVLKAISSAHWCSSDPLCIESYGQGMDSLNLAACHACSLLPETSCEEFNRLLDRALVIGLPDNTHLGYGTKLIG